MTRTVIALVLGVLLGAGVTLWLAPSSDAPPSLQEWLPPRPATAPAMLAAAPSAARESRDFYRRLADADAPELESLIAAAAARAPSTDRDLALAVLFKRYAELDAVRAVRLARETGVGGPALGAVYGAWARTAPEQVLAALSTVSSPDDATDVALALILALGDDATAVRRVGAVLAARAQEASAGTAGFAAPAMSPAGPLMLAAPRSALLLTAQRWAELDARRALVVARQLDDERVKLAFETAALRALARIAPQEAFAGLDASGVEPAAVTGTLLELARVDPERVLSVVRDMAPDARRSAELAALQQLAERDPLAAARHLDRVALGPERQMYLQIVARAYGKRDAAAALIWARELRGEPMAVSAVIAGIADNDPNRAFDFALELPAPMDRVRAVQMAASAGMRDDATAAATANRLLDIDEPQIRDMVAFTVVSMWASRSPDTAMQWLLANGQKASPNLFQQMGQQLATRDPRGAIAYTARIPDTAREQWASGVANGYAQSDPQGAIDWLDRFRGEQWYERAATTVAMTVAQRDGAAGARLLDDLADGAVGVRASQFVNIIATSWANQDPAAAAEWSSARATEEQRNAAVRGVIGIWVVHDADAARQWTLRQPRGVTRDVALTAVLMTSGLQTGGGVDASVLNAFASTETQQSAVLQLVQGVAFNDPAKARAIADTHLDAALRIQAARMIEAARNQQGGPPIEIGSMQNVGSVRGVAPALRAR